jgi:hypothetical protein
MAAINDEATQHDDDADEKERMFYAVKPRDIKGISDSLSEGSSLGQILVEKSMENVEFKQENDNLRYKLDQADRKHKVIDGDRAALRDMVFSLQQKLDGGAKDEDDMLTIENGNFIIPSIKAWMQKVQSIENERDEYKNKCDKFQRFICCMVSKGREQEVPHDLCLRSMKRTIDQAKETIDLLSQKCETFYQVIQKLGGEKAFQEAKIEALEVLFQDFNANRLGRSSQVTERGPCSYLETRKVSGL